jgi:hypothetical protein
MDRRRREDETDDRIVWQEPMESGMGGAGDISGGMGGSAGGDIGEMAEAGLLEGVDPRSAISLPPRKPSDERRAA